MGPSKPLLVSTNKGQSFSSPRGVGKWPESGGGYPIGASVLSDGTVVCLIDQSIGPQNGRYYIAYPAIYAGHPVIIPARSDDKGMLLSYSNEESQPIEQVFDEGEIKCLQQINNTLQGDTEKSKNNNPQRLSWATWIIARLGGWKNYNSKRPPGPIVLKKGLDKFTASYQGWQLATKFKINVS